MKTHYDLLVENATRAGYNKVGDTHTSRESAMTRAGYPDPADWTWANTDQINMTVKSEARHDRGSTDDWLIVPVQVPENDTDRVELATGLALEYGQIDGDHHKTWVIDQMLRALTGDRYAEVIADYRDGEDGPETYTWDEGIAP